jgi:hypothetical protein
MDNPDAVQKAYAVLNLGLQQQSALWAYIDQFRFLALVCLACAPLVFLFLKPTNNRKALDLH